MSPEEWINIEELIEVSISDDNCRQALLWCDHNIPRMDWDYTFAGFLFKHEKDAIMFALKWS